MPDCVSGFESLGTDNHPDPLAVWKVIAPNHPTIALMAREILSIPAASVGGGEGRVRAVAGPLGLQMLSVASYQGLIASAEVVDVDRV